MLISLDVWNTILEPNKTYASIRTSLIQIELNNIVRSLNINFNDSDIRELYSLTKNSLDNEPHFPGFGSNTNYAYDKLKNNILDIIINKYNIERFFIIKFDIVNKLTALMIRLQKKLEELFLKYRPTIPEETIETIHYFQGRNIYFSIGSNTNFINGKIIRQLFIMNNLKFSFYIFSDETNGYSKPNVGFFKLILNEMKNLPNHTLSDCIHIGDSSYYDNPGSIGFGYKIISSPIHLATAIKEAVK